MSDTHPAVSIIIPNYNHALYVGDAINSVLHQTCPDYEVIVVDDGSIDNSREIIDGFGDTVRAIYQPNQGLSAARNAGIREARGDFIGLLDADDMYEPEFLNSLVSLLKGHPEAGGAYCGYRFVDGANNPLPQIEAREIAPGELYRELLDGNFLVPEALLFRRTLYEAQGLFDESLRACEDWDVWLRASGEYTILCSTLILTRHRVLDGSMSTDPYRMMTNRLRVLGKHLGEEPLDRGMSQAHRAYGRAYLCSCVEYLQQDDRDRAYDAFRRMAHVCPGLLAERDSYYQLGCGYQRKGYMGDLESLDVRKSSQILLELLRRWFADAKIQNEAEGFHRRALAQAYYALGTLGYGTRQLRLARRFFVRAWMNDPGFLVDRRFLYEWLRSMMDPRFLHGLKRFSQKINYANLGALE